MQLQVGCGARNGNLSARCGETQSTFDQQRASLVEPELFEFYAHDNATCRTNRSTEPNRSTASFRAA
jgi:hypothetical protein